MNRCGRTCGKYPRSHHFRRSVPKVQELIASRRRKRRNGTTQIFAGLIKCADCGWSLAYGENKQNKTHTGTTIAARTDRDSVHEAVKGEDGSREQEVEIYYRFIGKID